MKIKFLTSVKWNFLSSSSQFLIRIVLNIVLARLLSPKDFGLIALILSITSFSDILINSGLRTAIVKDKSITHNELSSISIYNIFFGFVFTIIIFFGAGLIAMFYENAELIVITKALAFLYLLKAFYIVPNAVLEKDAKFKEIAIVNLIANILSGTLGIAMAVQGYHVWSLVAMNLLTHIISLIGFYYFSPYSFSFHFRFTDVKKHLKFGINILKSRILMQISDKIDYILMGKLLPISSLGFYNRGKEFALLPAKLLSGITSKSFYTHASSMAENFREKLFININYLALASVLPIYVFFFVFADFGILIILGEAWQESIPYFRFMLLFSFVTIVYSLNGYYSYTYDDSSTPLKAFTVMTFLRLILIFSLLFLPMENNTIILSVIGILIITGISYYIISLLPYLTVGIIRLMRDTTFFLILAVVIAVTATTFNNAFLRLLITSAGLFAFLILFKKITNLNIRLLYSELKSLR